MTTTDTAERPAVGPNKEGRGGRTALLVVLGVVLLLAVVYLVLWAIAGDKVPRGAQVEGVDVGGMSADDAERTLRSALAERQDAPVTVVVGGEETEVGVEDLGFAVDYPASVAEVGGSRSLAPARLWDWYTGGEDADAVLDVDDTALDARLAELDEQFGRPATEGGIEFADAEVVVTEAAEGRMLEPDVTREALTAAYLDPEPVAELALGPVVPDIDETDVQAAREEFADPAMSGPVRLVVGDETVRLAPRRYDDLLSMVPEDGALVPEVDRPALSALLEEAVPDDVRPVDATVRLVDGRPEVVPGEPGEGFGPAVAADALVEAAAGEGDGREVEVETRRVQPGFTADDARALGIRRQVSTFTTEFPYAEYRNTNIGQAADYIDGTVLRPGDTFSFNEVVGERTEARGFVAGIVVSDGIFAEGVGGGVSQMATTAYNAGFFAGLEDVEHRAHSVFIDRYPAGREATVSFGSLDMSFRNDTDFGVLLDTEVVPSTPSSAGSVTMSIWSTKVWDIESVSGEPYNGTSPPTRTLPEGPTCTPDSVGANGFDIDVTRVFREPGSSEVVDEETQTTRYNPLPIVVCEPPAPPQGNGNRGGGGNGGGGN